MSNALEKARLIITHQSIFNSHLNVLAFIKHWQLQIRGGRLDCTRSGLAQTANRSIPHRLPDLFQKRQLIGSCADRSTGPQAPKQLLLADCADPARNALAARFISKKRGDACEDIGHIHGFIKDHDDSGSQSRADGASSFERERNIELVWANERTRSATEQDRLNLLSAGDAPGHFNKLPKRAAERNFIQPRPHDVSRQTKQFRPGRSGRTDPGKSFGAIEDDERYVDERLDIIDDCRLAE